MQFQRKYQIISEKVPWKYLKVHNLINFIAENIAQQYSVKKNTYVDVKSKLELELCWLRWTLALF